MCASPYKPSLFTSAILTTREEEDVWLNTDDPEDGKVVEPDIYLSVLRPVLSLLCHHSVI